MFVKVVAPLVKDSRPVGNVPIDGQFTKFAVCRVRNDGNFELDVLPLLLGDDGNVVLLHLKPAADNRDVMFFLVQNDVSNSWKHGFWGRVGEGV